jgi:hypothetical protein
MDIHAVACVVFFVVGMLVGANNARMVNKVKNIVKNFIMGLKVTGKVIAKINETIAKAKAEVIEEVNKVSK